MHRRHAIKLFSTICASSIVLHRLPAMSTTPNGELTYGLLFDEADLKRIRDNFHNDPQFADFRRDLENFDMAAEYAFLEKELRYNDQLYDIGRLGTTAESMAFLTLMTGNEEAAKLAKRAVREIMKFKRWDFFLDGDKSIAVQRGSSSTVAVSLTADFLGNRVSKKERREWFRIMGERGCEACYGSLYGIRNPQDVEEWRFDPESTFWEHRPTAMTDMNRRAEITADTNLRAVPASALVIGAIAYQLEMGESPLTQRWLEMGTFSSEAFRSIFQPDGSYHEEVNYGHYTAQHLQQAVVSLARHTKVASEDLINWDGYMEFILNMSMPTHLDPYGIVNFGDSGRHPTSPRPFTQSSLPFWIAAVNRNSLAQWYAENLGGAHNFWSVIWRDGTIKPQPPAPGTRLWVSDLDRVVARTGFGVDDLVVAMRSGPPANHEHADRNSIIVKCYGEQLVADPLRPPYGYADPSWPLRLTQGHSAILIDGRGHEHHNGAEGTNPSRSFARITHQESTSSHAQWTSDATQPYRLVDLDVKKVVRTMVVLYDEPAVIVVDRFSKYKNPSFFTARFFGFNFDGELAQEVLSDGFTVQRPHAAMRAATYASVGTNTLKGKLDIAPEISDYHPYIDVATAPAMDVLLVTVLSLGREISDTKAAVFKQGKDGRVVTIGSSRIKITPEGCSVL